MSHVQSTKNSRPADPWRAAGLFAIRYGIGGVIVLAGFVVLVADGGELGWLGFASAIGAGLSVVLLNLLYRMSVSGDRDREREEEARRYFDEHGEWPEEEHRDPVSRRQWVLPMGVVTRDQEQDERRRTAPHRAPVAVWEGR